MVAPEVRDVSLFLTGGIVLSLVVLVPLYFATSNDEPIAVTPTVAAAETEQGTLDLSVDRSVTDTVVTFARVHETAPVVHAETDSRFADAQVSDATISEARVRIQHQEGFVKGYRQRVNTPFHPGCFAFVEAHEHNVVVLDVVDHKVVMYRGNGCHEDLQFSSGRDVFEDSVETIQSVFAVGHIECTWVLVHTDQKIRVVQVTPVGQTTVYQEDVSGQRQHRLHLIGSTCWLFFVEDQNLNWGPLHGTIFDSRYTKRAQDFAVIQDATSVYGPVFLAWIDHTNLFRTYFDFEKGDFQTPLLVGSVTTESRFVLGHYNHSLGIMIHNGSHIVACTDPPHTVTRAASAGLFHWCGTEGEQILLGLERHDTNAKTITIYRREVWEQGHTVNDVLCTWGGPRGVNQLCVNEGGYIVCIFYPTRVGLSYRVE